MRSFQEIFEIAADRKGGSDALDAMLSRPKSAAELADVPDHRWLSQVTKSIFQAGFNWKVIEAKWSGFEEAFHGFDITRCAHLHPEEFGAILSNKGVVRNGIKLQSVQHNAQFFQELEADGGVAQVIANWPNEDYIGLLDMLKARGSRIGGATGQYAMRFMGRDGFVLSTDVTARLIAEGVIDKPATSKGAMRAVQAAFNTWAAQSGRSLTEISGVLARSL